MLEKVIQQLSPEKFSSLADSLISSKGEKLVYLLHKYREEANSEELIMEELKLNSSSFYTLRSRLFDKLRLFLFQESEYEETEILKNVQAIPFILLTYQKETTITLLTHLENELIRMDMQLHLISVYGALKKVHVNSEKYYFYEQCYNKTVAYTLSQNKAEELLLLFCKTLSGYLLSRSESVREVLLLYLKEIHNQTLLYNSVRMTVYHKIGHLNYLIFVDGNFSEYYPGKSTEELLRECKNSLEEIGKNGFKENIEMCIRFLNFHYYHRLKLYKNTQEISLELMQNPIELCNLYPITCPGIFTVSLIEKNLQEKIPLKNLSNYFQSLPQPEPANEVMLIYHHLANAALQYDAEEISLCDQALQKIINFNFLKKYPYTDTEVKLFYIFILLLNEKSDIAENSLRSLTRKSEIANDTALQFLALLKLCLSSNSVSKQKKIFDAFKLFKAMNNNENAFLSYLQIKEKHILQLSMI